MRRYLFAAHGAHLAGGAEMCLEELLRGLTETRPDVELHVVFPESGPLVRAYAARGWTTHVSRYDRWATFGRPSVSQRVRNALSARHYRLRFRELIDEVAPDIVVSNTMSIGLPGEVAAEAGVPHVTLIHEFGQADHGLVFRHGYESTLTRIARSSRVVICNSRSVRRSLVPYIPADHLAVARQAVDTPDVVSTAPSRSDGDAIVLVLVGRVAPSKGPSFAVELLSEAVRQHVDASLLLVGGDFDAHQKVVAALAARLGVLDRVRFVGVTAEPWKYMAAAHVALMCSPMEAFGRVTVEAMKLGLPVVGVNSGGTAEILQDGDTGYLVPLGNASAAAERVRRLWEDEGLRQRMGNAARAAATSTYTLCGYAREFSGILAQAGVA